MPSSRRLPPIPWWILAVDAILIAISIASGARSAPPWVERPITLPRHDVSFDVGFGLLSTAPPDPATRRTGPGLDFELGVGITQHLELGVRAGVRLGEQGTDLHGDEAGRIFDRQTFDGQYQRWANPEVRLRGSLLHGRVAELALEGRLVLPFSGHLGALFGMPLAFHAGNSVRVDTGVFVPVIFDEPTFTGFNVPVDVWIQATRTLFLGPMTGVRIVDFGRQDRSRTDVSLGFGLGVALDRAIDLKTMGLFPRINGEGGARTFEAGIAFQFRIE